MNYEKETARLLRAMGASGMYCGFKYSIYALSLALEDRVRLTHITKGLYQEVAKRYHTSWICVERDIRRMIEIIWNYGDKELLAAIYGERYVNRPPNTIFLEALLEFIEQGGYNYWERQR